MGDLSNKLHEAADAAFVLEEALSATIADHHNRLTALEVQQAQDHDAIVVNQSAIEDLLARVEVLENGSDPDPPDPYPGVPLVEGFARQATGGQNGSAYVVTTLADSGPGSLRDALSQGDRYITFAVDGVIQALNQITCNSDNITIDAEGYAVTVQGNGLDHVLRFAGCENIVCLNLKLQGKKVEWGNERDCLSIENCNLMAFDHCTFRWGTDECVGVKKASDITFQWCMIYECLLPHSTGMLIREETDRINVHHCLFAHNLSRNPQFGVSLGSENTLFDLRNNVIYNDGIGGRRAAIEFKKLGHINVIKNWYRRGPDGLKDFAMVVENGGQVYLENNLPLNVATWLDPAPDKQGTASPYQDIGTEIATELLGMAAVLAGAGCVPRDADDTRVVNDVKNGTGHIKDTPP